MASAEVILSAKKRANDKKPKESRNEGLIPAVVYGKHQEPISVEFDYQEFRKAYRITGDSTLLTLDIEGEKVGTLIHDIQYEPVKDDFIHIDLLAVKDDEPVKAHIPLEFVGLAPAVKNFSGILVTPIDHLEIKCLPKYLLHDIKVDVTSIEDFHTSIHVKDLDIFNDENIEVLTDGDETVASVSPPKGTSIEDAEAAAEGE